MSKYPEDYIYVIDNFDDAEIRFCHKLKNFDHNEYQRNLIPILIEIIEDRNDEIDPGNKLIEDAVDYQGIHYSYKYYKQEDNPTEFTISINIKSDNGSSITIFICTSETRLKKQLKTQTKKTGHTFELRESGPAFIRLSSTKSIGKIQSSYRKIEKEIIEQKSITPDERIRNISIPSIDALFKSLRNFDELIGEIISEYKEGTNSVEAVIEFLNVIKMGSVAGPYAEIETFTNMAPYNEKVKEYVKQYEAFLNCLTVVFTLIQKGKEINLETALTNCFSKKPLTRAIDIYRPCGNPECENINSKYGCACEKIYYCSKECQLANRSDHKPFCKKIEKKPSSKKGGRSKRKKSKKSRKKSYW